MHRRCFSLFGLLLVSFCALAQAPYYPDAVWQRKTPAEAGINAQRLKDAIDYAVANETRNPRDLTLNHYQTFGREPFGYAIGPIKDRGDLTGVVVHKGYIVAEWGEPLRVDMTHSVTKSLLSSVVGVAYDRGLIKRIDDPDLDAGHVAEGLVHRRVVIGLEVVPVHHADGGADLLRRGRDLGRRDHHRVHALLLLRCRHRGHRQGQSQNPHQVLSH